MLLNAVVDMAVQKGMDTPGIEPGAFRLQSGRATTALCAQMIHDNADQFHTSNPNPYHTKQTQLIHNYTLTHTQQNTNTNTNTN